MLLHGRRPAARQSSAPPAAAPPAAALPAAPLPAAALPAAAPPASVPPSSPPPAAAHRPARRPARLRWVCAIAAAAVLPVLAGCEAGYDAPILQWHPPTAGASKAIVTPGTHGYLAIRNVFVVGAPLNAELPAGSSAGVFMALVNTGPGDRLIKVTAPGTAASVTLPSGGVGVARDQSALLTGPTPEVVLRGLLHGLPSGGDIKLVLQFQRAGLVTMYVPVMAKAAYYATYSPAPSPTASTRHRHHRHAVATASPGVTPTPSATSTG
jgi:hypothetical protein